MALNTTHAEPRGTEVWDTRSRTSQAVNRIRESPVNPSDDRNATVLKNIGLLLF